ncbi:MAG: hypothetical protein JXL20_13625 [Deltaproteobacteria bacterium]|nr:hypothetical protein [Deltaproteobacteria bacterium]
MNGRIHSFRQAALGVVKRFFPYFSQLIHPFLHLQLFTLIHYHQVENGEGDPFTGLTEKVHRQPEYPNKLRLQVCHKISQDIRFFETKDWIVVLDALTEIVTPAFLLHHYGTLK